MHNIKILALDLDGTLLDSEKHISIENKNALAAAAARGILVVPTTGRFFGMMPECVKELPFVRYAITVNGAQVFDRQTNAALIKEEIPISTSIDIMQLLDGYDVIYDCYRNNWGWMTKTLQDKAPEYATNIHYLDAIRNFRNPVKDLKAHLLSTDTEGDVQKIMLFSRNNESTNILKAIADNISATFPDIKITSSTWNNLELNIATAHKGIALKRFAEHFGWTLDNCMSFGDGMNDLSMIQAAGTGVAMANACDEVKAEADYITCSNDENGVAEALKHFGII